MRAISREMSIGFLSLRERYEAGKYMYKARIQC